MSNVTYLDDHRSEPANTTLAEYVSFCEECGSDTIVGEPVARKNGRWVHANCS